MVPAAFVLLESLPLTNGKLDRSALQRPGNQRPDLRTAYVPPRNNIERSLSRIWEGVLVTEKVGIHDNFFDLGGHSLAAARIISGVIKQFQLELPIKALFESPTVAEMAAVITTHQGKQLTDGELARVLGELESLSDEEAQRLLAKETTSSDSGPRHE
jgi:surfactin family lipopeptide synthetase C